ncbi:ABC transporter substrate-binding protein [Streptomyces sp. NBC_00820]|uniref:ABC transporter substrate-binding protein n=1 Tax=Streptomyces sp. NBC_00820 TaxID=2975842 RepID=UPI002ED2522B|nr:ABC transporter substrate-binding protein [Streptomyces sp. NBC_00820]
MSTEGGIDVQQQLESLIRDFRTSDPPMPVVVLHAEEADDDERVVGSVEELCAGQNAHGTRCAVASPDQEGSTEVRRAAALVRDLGDPKRWGTRASLYRRYAFPRLRLVHAIEDAVRELGPDWPAPPAGASPAASAYDPAQRLLNQLAKQRWRPKSAARWHSGVPLFDMAHILPASLVAVLTALLARTDWYTAVILGVGFLLLLAVLSSVLPGRAPIFLWLRRESKWFMTTTFLRAAARGRVTEVSLLRPVRSWQAIAARAFDVAEALNEGDEFQLQLYVLALFEDLRDNHRRWSWDLRGFKRPRPPMLFLPHVGTGNGGIELIKAVSDVRSRRSELDPLLCVAAVPAADIQRLERSVVGEPQPGRTARPFQDRLRDWYEEWARSLRSGQSPSRERAVVPWVLKIPLPSSELAPLRDRRRHCVKASTRPTLARVAWALHTLVVVAVVVAATVAVRAEQLSREYCSATVLTANRDTRREATSGGSTECIGIATGDVRFADWLPKSEPGGHDAKASTGVSHAPWTLAELEGRIGQENDKVLDTHPGHYVSVVYAGPLSVDPHDGSAPVKGVEELAGVYLAQAVINDTFTVKLRVLIANGGVDLDHQTDMAKAIASYAATDPTLVGVVGTGRDLKSSEATTRTLRDAGLPVVSGTNSATYLPREFANWFSLAATDEWQVSQLGLIARQLRTPGSTQFALTLARDTARTDDRYTDEQARYGGQMLSRYGFTPLPQRRYTLTGGKPEFRLPAEEFCGGDRVPSVIYFAGRVEDVDPLMTQLGTEPGCADKKISIITGDDLSKADFAQGRDAVAPRVTLYHASLAELRKPARGTTFYQDAGRYLPGLDKQSTRYDTATFASGQTALAHDATRALYWAATRNGIPQSRAATWVNLRTVNLEGMATGTIDFTHAPLYGDRSGHSIVLMEVWHAADGSLESREVCSRVAGDVRPLTGKECSISHHG